MTLINYKVNKVSATVKYSCVCGHKFTRINTEEFTMSPFNKLSFEDNVKHYRSEAAIKQRKCPKCNSVCTPTTK